MCGHLQKYQNEQKKIKTGGIRIVLDVGNSVFVVGRGKPDH